MHVESAAYFGIDENNVIYDVRRDSFIGVNLDYNFCDHCVKARRTVHVDFAA